MKAAKKSSDNCIVVYLSQAGSWVVIEGHSSVEVTNKADGREARTVVFIYIPAGQQRKEADAEAANYLRIFFASDAVQEGTDHGEDVLRQAGQLL